jgi:hypothetical protein
VQPLIGWLGQNYAETSRKENPILIDISQYVMSEKWKGMLHAEKL